MLFMWNLTHDIHEHRWTFIIASKAFGGKYFLDICDMIKGNESLVENSYYYFLTPLSHNFKIFILMQTALQLDIWLQIYEEFANAKNNIKQRILNTFFPNISKTKWPTSDSFLLIMSHINISVHLLYTLDLDDTFSCLWHKNAQYVTARCNWHIIVKSYYHYTGWVKLCQRCSSFTLHQ